METQPFLQLKDQDLTKETAPSLDIMRDLIQEVIRPSQNAVAYYMGSNCPKFQLASVTRSGRKSTKPIGNTWVEIPAANNFFGSRLSPFPISTQRKGFRDRCLKLNFRQPKPLAFAIQSSGSGQFVVESDEGRGRNCSQPNQISDANAYLISAAPKLYQALGNFAFSEEALMKDGIGCECDRCEKARQEAYRAIGFAEGNDFKEGGLAPHDFISKEALNWS